MATLAVGVVLGGAALVQPAQAGCFKGRCNAPTTTLTVPAANATYGNAQNIVVSGRATGDYVIDSVGEFHYFTISRVEVYNGGTLVGNATLGARGGDDSDREWRNYSYTFAPMAVGAYTLKVKAYDSGGSAEASFTQVNISVVQSNAAPSVALTSPSGGAVLTVNKPATLTATASDSDGSVTGVQYFDGATAISGVVTAPPYTFIWTPTTLNAHTLKAVATDNAGASTPSASIGVTVNDAPAVTVSVSNVTSQAPGSVTLQANASDSVGGVSSVQYFANGSAISGTLTSAPYVFTWGSVGGGTYSFTARATDTYGLTTDSGAVAINVAVNAPPVSSGSGTTGKLTGALNVGSGGSSQYTIPVTRPPGTAGMAPAVALKYDSGGGNGVAGVGWSLTGLSQISRCGRDFAHDNARAGVDLSAGDPFCLDAQRLILVSGSQGAAGSQYRTEIESFSRIEAIGSAGNGPASFVVTLRDGTRLEYGNTADAKMMLPLATPPASTTPWAWSVNKASDPRGNYFTVSYATTTGQQVPTRIDYTGNANAAPALLPYNSIQFSYDTNRPDVETRHVLGAKIVAGLRLANIKTYTGATLVQDYRIAYDTSLPTGRSRVRSVTACGDVAGSSCLAPTTFDWENTPVKFDGPVLDYGTLDAEFGELPIARGDRGGQYWADINGDGRPDHCIHNNIFNPTNGEYFAGEMYCRLTQPGGAAPVLVKIGNFAPSIGPGPDYRFMDANNDGIADVCFHTDCRFMGRNGPTGDYSRGPAGGGSYDPYTDLVDIDGDNRLDYCRVTNDGVAATPYRLECYLSTGTGWGPAINLGSVAVDTCTDTAPCQAMRFSWADVSGDGIPSFCRIEGFASAGPLNGVLTCRKWTPSGLAAEISTGLINLGEKNGRTWADANGDGKADYCRVIRDGEPQAGTTPGHVACTLSTGGGFGDTLVSGTMDIGSVADNAATPGPWVDVNGDGRIDFCRTLTTGAATECALSSGTGFASAGAVPKPSSGTVIGWVDADGDGRPEVCYGIYTAEPTRTRCLTASGTQQDLLLGVTDGYGVNATLYYRPLTDEAVYTKGSGAVFPVADLQDSTLVVQRVRASNGAGGSNEMTYRYEGGKVHQQGRGFLGFGATTSTTPAGLVNRVESLTDLPYSGLVKRNVASSGGVALSEASITYAASASAPYVVVPTLTVTKTRDLNGAFINWIERGTAQADHDAYGNPLKLKTVYKDAAGNADGHGQDAVVTYLNDTANWMLGLPTRLATTSHAPGQSDSTRTTASSYAPAHPGLGLLQQTLAEPDNGGLPGVTNLRLVTDYSYDAFGNVLTRTVSGARIPTRAETTNTYDPQGRGPVTIKNALGHQEKRTHDWRHGGIASVEGPNGLTTTWTFDAFGRPLTEDRADGTRTTTSYNPCMACVPGAVYSTSTTHTVIAGGATAAPPGLTYHDMLGRVILETQPGLDSRWVYQETQYDSLGRVGYKSAKHFSGDPVAYGTRFEHDPLGRALKVTAPDNSLTITAYNGRTVSRTNDKGITSSRTVNSQGKVVAVTDAAGTASASNVAYEYDAWANLARTTDAAGNVTTTSYDLLGRRTRLVDPDMGTWIYEVDNLGQVTSQTDAKGQGTTYSYDLLGRLTRGLEGDLDSRWYYEANAQGTPCSMGIGKLCEATASNGYYRRNRYDSLGRLGSQTTHLDADYTADWGFDAAGRLSTQTFPATVGAFPRLAVTYNYNPNGILQSVANGATGTAYWTRSAENADGNLTREIYGNGLVGTRGYDAVTGRLTSLQAGPEGAPGAVQNQGYHHDSLGRLEQRQDSVAGTSETFGYDAQNRLTIASLSAPGVGTQASVVTFDAIGNITSKTGVGSYTYPAAGSARPHAVSGVAGTVNGVANPGYSYDANGNMLTGGARSFSWTSFNMPGTLTKTAQAGGPGAGVSSFLYGPEHQRIQQTWVDSAKTLTTWYLGEPHFEKEANTQTGITEYRHYVEVGGRVVAIQTRRSNGTEDVKYLIPDHLGSTSVVTDAAGAVVERQAFDPWGDRRVASGSSAGAADPTNAIQPGTNRGYTGHEQLDQGSLGLIHMNGRVYDPTLGRFISADPNVQALFNTQSFNRYSYVWNDPLNLVDPSGFFTEVPIEKVIITGSCPAGSICGPAAVAWLQQMAAAGQVYFRAASDYRRLMTQAGPRAALILRPMLMRSAARAGVTILVGLGPENPVASAAGGVVLVGSLIYEAKQNFGALANIFNEAVGEEAAGEDKGAGANTAPASPPPDGDGNDKTEHGKQRANEAKTDPNRNVGDSNRVIRDGRRYMDNDTGNTVHVSGDRVVVTNEQGEVVTQFKNTRANTNARVESGRWTPF